MARCNTKTDPITYDYEKILQLTLPGAVSILFREYPNYIRTAPFFDHWLRRNAHPDIVEIMCPKKSGGFFLCFSMSPRIRIPPEVMGTSDDLVTWVIATARLLS